MIKSPIALDGIFGKITENLVKDFQNENHLVSDGVVGRKTWKVILSINTKSHYKKPLKYSCKYVDVSHLQNALNVALKINRRLTTDGHFGRRTDKYVRKFQAKHSLAVDGIVGKETWLAIEQLLTGKILVQPKVFNQSAIIRLQQIVRKETKVSWLAIAMKEMGVKEVKGASHNPRIVSYHASTTLKAKTDEVPWCSSFVNWVLTDAGHKGTNSAAAISWLKWGKKSGPVPSAIAVIHNSSAANSSLTRSGNHVGFLVAETDTYFELLGGNQGNRVKVSRYPKPQWKLKGYRLPSNK